MRFHRLVLAAVTLLAVNTLSGNNGITFADETEATEKPEESIAPETETYSYPEESESFEFQAEVHRVLDIVVNSLYQKKDVFLRELISNASDALDKIRFLGIENPELMKEKEELEIRIQYDESNGSLTITDSGIGMTHDDLVNNLGTVARSGTTRFLDTMKDGTSDISMIGQFGVGFYSSFLVAERVRVASKHPEDPVQHVWESVNGESSFHIYDDPRGDTLGRGTEITLFLKEDAFDYCNAEKLKTLATFYSEFIDHPIFIRTTTTMDVEVKDDEEEEDKEEKDEESEEDELEVKEDEEDEEEDEKEPKMEKVTTHSWDQVNTNKPIWSRDKDEISDDDYQAFWKVVSKEEYNNATSWIHFNAEGNINFKSILYLPSEVPPGLSDSWGEEVRGGLKLYVRRVLISDEFELLPRYLSVIIKGVVDSDDLPLNVNREALQESKIIKIISKKLVRKVIEMIRKLSEKKVSDDEEVTEEKKEEDEFDEEEEEEEEEKEKEEKEHPYVEWYKKFGTSIKMGVIEDDANQMKLLKLLRFKSSKYSGEKDWVSLEEYVERMKDWQEDIYFFAGLKVEELENSEFMDIFNDKDVEVLYFTDTMDEYMIQRVLNFDGKKFTSITKANLKFNDEDEDLAKKRENAYKEKFKPLTKFLKDTLAKDVTRVSISKRLEHAPAIVASGEYGHSANMERIMKAQALQHGAQEGEIKTQRVLEINPRHPFITKLLGLVTPPEGEEKDDFKPDESTIDLAWMLYDMATLNSGFSMTNTVSYSDRIIRALQAKMGVDSLELEEEINPPVEEDEPPEVDETAEGINMDDFDFDSEV